MEEKKEFTKEQLSELLHQATNQNAMLRNSLSEMRDALYSKRLDYLFKMIENSTMFDVDVMAKACVEIEETMFPKTDTTTEE